MATGVASPRAQGHDITSTDIAQESANSKSCPVASQAMAVTRAMVITTGTNTPAILSASFAIGAFEALASSTSFIIWASVVSLPTFSALNFKNPFLLIEAAIILSPTVFSTGMLSPVRADSSTDEFPSTIIPSAGILAPGLTITISPAFSSSIGISVSTPFLSTTAVSGASSVSLDIASLVFLLERVSRNLPRVMSVSIITEDSK